ncbi:MAG: hypothetical protein QOF98_2622, partial [Streptomyces sp.]|nr:hypothetical protein [Streptomyces sp.]
PGGPKASGGVLLVGVVLAALAGLMRGTRRTAIGAAWVAAVVALLFAVVENSKDWAGPATLVYGIALLAAAAIGAENANERIATSGFGWRQPVAALVAFAAAAAPLLAAFTWVVDGADGPIKRGDPQQVPAFVAEESTTADQPRTLVIDGTAGRVSYALVRGSGAHLGDAELAAEANTDSSLNDVVANLVAGSGADQGTRLAGYAIRYVLAEKGVPRSYGRILDSTPGLSRVSQTGGTELWEVDTQTARITITSKGADPVSVAAGQVDAHTKVPAGPSGRVLRLADSAASGWQATLDGEALTPVTVDGWAQGFDLPASGGTLDVTFKEPVTHIGWLGVQGFLLLVVIVLALPGRRREIDDDLPEADGAVSVASVPLGADIPGQAIGEGRRARRLQAAAEAEGVAPEDSAEAAADAADSPETEQPPEPVADPYEQPAYDPAEGGYDPYAVPAGAEAGYNYQEQGYQDPGYAQGGPYPADPATYEQQAGGYTEGYGYVPQQPGYDPYAPAGQDDQTTYGVGQDYGQGYGGEQQGYVNPEQPGYPNAEPGYGPEQQGYANPEQGYGEEQGYVDPSTYVDPAAYYADGEPRRDGSEHQ